MDANTLMLIFNLLIVFIIVTGLLAGLMRGFKKTTYKVITTILFYGILLLSIDAVAKMIVEAPLIEALYNSGAASSLPPYLEGCVTLKDACVAILLEQGIESTEVIPVAMSLAVVVAKLIYIIIYLIPIAFIYWILTSIIWLIIRPLFGSKYKKVKGSDGSISKKKKKKHRLLGGLMGAIKKVPQAALVIIMTTGVISMLPTIDTSTGKYENLSADINSDALMDFVEQYNLGEYVKFVEMYRNSAYVKVLGGLDVKDNSIATKVFKKLTNGVYEDYTLDFQSEMALMLNTGIKVLSITDGTTDMNQLSVIQQKQLLDVLKDTTDSELIMSLIPMGVGIALSLEMVKQNLPAGLEIDPSLFANVNWESDIISLADAAKELVDISNGFQNIKNIDYLHMDVTHVKTLTTMLANIGAFMNVVPVLVDYALNTEQVQTALGDLVVNLENIVWSDEIVNMGEIYEKFAQIGLTSFENIFGQFQNFTGEQFDSTKTLISSVFDSEFVSQVFPATFNVMMNKQPENVKQLFNDVTINSWENEFTTLVDLAREVVDNGGSLEKIDLSIVKNVQVDTILKSDLLEQGMVKIFATAEDEGSVGAQIGLNNYLYIPTKFKDTAISSPWFDTKDGETLVPGELRKILTSVQNIIKTLPDGEVDFGNLPNYMLSIDDKYLDSVNHPNDSIFNSEILRASISDFVTTDPTIKENIVIPDNKDTVEAVDDIKVIKETELESMVKGVKALGITDFSNLGNINGDLIANLNELYGDTSETNIDVLLKSNIVKLTVSNVLNNMDATSEQLTIPAVAKENKKVLATNGTQYEQIKTDEFKNIVKAVSVPAIQNALSDLSNPQLDPTILKSLGDAEVDTILKSSIINYNLTSQIENFKTTGVLSYPDDPTIINTDGLINPVEVKAVIATINNLDITDFNDMNQVVDKINLLVKNAETTPDYSNLDKMLESKILHATVSSKMKEVLTELPPSVYKTGTGFDNTYINENEIHSIVLGVVLLGDNISADLPLSKIYEINNKGKLDEILNSNILRSQISEVLLDVGSTFLVVPNKLKTSELGETKTFTYIDKSEFTKIIKAMETLGFDNNSTLDVTPKFLFSLLDQDGSGNTKLDTLLASNIMHATLSKVLIDNSGASKLLILPNNVKLVDEEVTYITKNEIKALTKSLKTVTPANIDSFDAIPLEPSILFNLVDGTTNQGLKAVLGSKILHASITDKMLSASSLVVPNHESVYTTVEGTPYANIDELAKLINGFKHLNPGLQEGNALPLDISFFSTMEKPELKIVFGSAILRATISKNAQLDTIEAFVIPNEAYDSLFGSMNVLSVDEMANLVYALGSNGLGLTSFDKNNVTEALILSLSQQKMMNILDSKIFHASITKIMHDSSIKSNSALVIPNKSYTDSTHNYLAKNEIWNVIETIQILAGNPSSFENLTFSPLNLKNGDGTYKDVVKSYIVQATLSNALLKVSGLTITVEAKDPVEDYISKAEIQTLLQVLSEFGTTDLDAFTFNTGAIKFFAANQAMLKSSKILIATFSKTAEGLLPPLALSGKTRSVQELGKTTTVNVINDDYIDAILNAINSAA